MSGAGIGTGQEILFLAHRLPFPPDRGDKIRSHHILQKLATIAPVHVACFADSDGDWAHEGELENLAASHCLVARNKRLPLAGLEALATGQPVSLAAFCNRKIADYVDEILASRPIGAIYVFSGQMGQYVPADFSRRVVVDLVDVDSAKFEAYAETASWPMRWVHAREGCLLRAEEARLAARADHTLLVSEAEAQLLHSRLPSGTKAKVASLCNGIDTVGFDPATVDTHAELSEQGPHCVFTGQMDYPPNIAAAKRFAERILPELRNRYPAAKFHVVGRAPTEEVRKLAMLSGVCVWGEVPDVKPFLVGADLVVAPLEVARGVQNKVLEAMAMARPVLLTPGAATGIEAEDGRHFAVEQDDQGLVARGLALLANRGAAQAMGRAAREFVVEQQGWDAMLADLPQIMGFDEGCKGEGSRNAA